MIIHILVMVLIMEEQQHWTISKFLLCVDHNVYSIDQYFFLPMIALMYERATATIHE